MGLRHNVFRAGQGGVFYRRFDLDPKLIPWESLIGNHTTAQIIVEREHPTIAGRRTRFRYLLSPFVGWLTCFERWVAETAGKVYQEQVLSSWRTAPVVPVAQMASRWEGVARRCAGLEFSERSYRGLRHGWIQQIGTQRSQDRSPFPEEIVPRRWRPEKHPQHRALAFVDMIMRMGSILVANATRHEVFLPSMHTTGQPNYVSVNAMSFAPSRWRCIFHNFGDALLSGCLKCHECRFEYRPCSKLLVFARGNDVTKKQSLSLR